MLCGAGAHSGGGSEGFEALLILLELGSGVSVFKWVIAKVLLLVEVDQTDALALLGLAAMLLLLLAQHLHVFDLLLQASTVFLCANLAEVLVLEGSFLTRRGFESGRPCLFVLAVVEAPAFSGLLVLE